MRCPIDSSVLVIREIDGVNVHVCPADDGMYLERGELNRLAEPSSGDLEFSTVDLDSLEHQDTQGKRECPADPGTEMVKVEFNILSNIILDYCEKCRGFWIDQGELARIRQSVDSLEEAEDEVPDPPMLWLEKFLWNLPFPK
ncbi:MAG: zf-TFIIB domain-containing protein [Acidobacteria bacterium]|nr:zf-TFIIB domain-containing protein [Acidobacteriota bacterium]